MTKQLSKFPTSILEPRHVYTHSTCVHPLYMYAPTLHVYTNSTCVHPLYMFVWLINAVVFINNMRSWSNKEKMHVRHCTKTCMWVYLHKPQFKGCVWMNVMSCIEGGIYLPTKYMGDELTYIIGFMQPFMAAYKLPRWALKPVGGNHIGTMIIILILYDNHVGSNHIGTMIIILILYDNHVGSNHIGTMIIMLILYDDHVGVISGLW